MMRTTLYEAAQVMLLRSGKMVMAKGLGDEDRQAPRDEKGNRCTGSTVALRIKGDRRKLKLHQAVE
jgi:hypothetical protein